MFEKSVLTYDVVEELFSHVTVHCWQRVVHDIDVRITVYCPSKADSLFLSPTHIDSLQ